MLPAAAVTDVLTSFVGRDVELGELSRWLHGGRGLATLVGPGGIGKTRLALRLADQTAALFPDGTVFVGLDSVHAPELVAGTLLEATGIEQRAKSSPLQVAVEHFRRKRSLLILDSCEHVLASASTVAAELAAGCPDVTVVATSREPLNIPGEIVWPVPPLPTESPDGGPSEAARLLLDRALHAVPESRRTAPDVDAIDRIVRGVDGVPLAIELAAARMRMLSWDELAASIHHHLRLLTGGPRAVPRQQTMWDSIDWSHRLLSDAERLLFRRLGVFADGWTIDAVQDICADPLLPRARVVEELTALVDKSLVHPVSLQGSTRFRMLNVVRQYARERLADAGEEEVIARRHFEHYLAFAETSDRERWALSPARTRLLDLESPNLRAAVRYGCEASARGVLRLVAALGTYWRERGRLAEGIAATEQALAAGESCDDADRALALASVATLAFWRGDFDKMSEWVTTAIALGERLGATRAHAHGLTRWGCAVMLVDPANGDPLLLRGAELAGQAGDQVVLSDALTCLTLSYHFQEKYGDMEEVERQALAVAEPIGFGNDIRWCLWCSAHRARVTGDRAGAREFALRALSTAGGDEPLSHACLVEVLALLDVMGGDPLAARDRVRPEMDRARHEVVRLGMGALIHAAAVAELALGDLDAARHWAQSLYEGDQSIAVYLGWHAQEVLMLVALESGDVDRARKHAAQVEQFGVSIGNVRATAVAALGLASAALLADDVGTAETLAHRALAEVTRHGWWPDALNALDILGVVASRRAQHDRAARLFASTQAERARRGLVRIPAEPALWRGLLGDTRAALGDEVFAATWREGATIPASRMVELAGRGRGRRIRPEHGWESLTPVERQVARLAAQGLDNPHIAERLFVSRSTVKAHLSHVFAKLRLSNRTELAARIASEAADGPGTGSSDAPSGPAS